MPRRVAIDINLHIFQYKILNNVLNLNEKILKVKLFIHLFVLFVNETPVKQNLFGLNSKSY